MSSTLRQARLAALNRGPEVVPPLVSAQAGPRTVARQAVEAVNDAIAEVAEVPSADPTQIANKLLQPIRGATGAEPLFTFLIVGLVVTQLIFSILTLRADRNVIVSSDRTKAIVNQVIAYSSFLLIAYIFGFEFMVSSSQFFKVATVVVISAVAAALTATPAPIGFQAGTTPVASVHGEDVANLVFTSILFGVVLWSEFGTVFTSWFEVVKRVH